MMFKFHSTMAVFTVGAAAVLLIAAGSASAGVIYSDFDPTVTTYGDNGVYPVRGTAEGNVNAISQAVSFTPTADATFGSIVLPLLFNSDDSYVDVALTSDNSGIPGTVLESWNNQIGSQVSFGLLTLDAANDDISLSAGSTYWITLQVADPSTNAAAYWAMTDPVVPLTDTDFLYSYSTSSPFTWMSDGAFMQGPLPAFEVISAVPEPSAVGLIGLSSVGLLARRRGRLA